MADEKKSSMWVRIAEIIGGIIIIALGAEALSLIHISEPTRPY